LQASYMSVAGKTFKTFQWIRLRNGWKVVQLGSDLYHFLDVSLLVIYTIVPFLILSGRAFMWGLALSGVHAASHLVTDFESSVPVIQHFTLKMLPLYTHAFGDLIFGAGCGWIVFNLDESAGMSFAGDLFYGVTFTAVMVLFPLIGGRVFEQRMSPLSGALLKVC